MALDKHIVAFAHDALPEIVLADQTGILAPPFDTQTLAQHVATLIQQPILRHQMGLAGQQRVLKTFDVRQTTQAVEQIYAQLLSRS